MINKCVLNFCRQLTQFQENMKRYTTMLGWTEKTVSNVN